MVIEPALHLRFRDDAATSEPLASPDVGAFLRSSTLAAGPPPRPAEALGVLPGTRPADPDGPLVIFFQPPEFGIPAPGYDHSLPDLECWSIRPTTFGWIASVAPATRGPRRAAQVLAGCLALALPTRADALQAPWTMPPPIQAPAGQTARAPATQQPTEPEPTPASTPEPAVTPPPAVTTPPPAVTTTMPPPAFESAVTDAAWEGVDGFDVIVELKGGKALRGRIGAVQTDTFTLIDGTDGQILVIPKSGVSSLRAHVPPPIPTKTGTGMLVGGSILTAFGVPVFITGIAFVAICPSCIYLHLPMLVIGGGGLGGGIPMITRGIQRRTAFQKAMQEHRITPMVSRTPYGGWQGGLQIRF